MAAKSRLSHEMVQNVALSVGITSIDKHVASSLAMDTESRIREVIQDAIKYMRHGKRKRLSPDDITFALSGKNVQPIFGFGGNDPSTYSDIQQTEDLFFIDSPTVTSESLISEPIQAVKEPNFCAHWFAIRGQQLYEREKKDEPRQRKRKALAPEIRSRVQHNLSKESQKYYETLQNCIERGLWDVCSAICNSLRQDAGLNQLLPYLISYFAQIVGQELEKENPHMLRLNWMVRVADSIVSSNTLANGIEPYLDQLFTPLISVMVCERVCANPATENHFQLRELAASVLAKVLRLFDKKHPRNRVRITEQLEEALRDCKRPLSTHYGCLVGLEALGIQTIETVLMPMIEPYLDSLRPLLKPKKKPTLQWVPSAPEMIYQAWVRIACSYSRHLSCIAEIKIKERRANDLKEPPKKKVKKSPVKVDKEARLALDPPNQKEETSLYGWLMDSFGPQMTMYAPPGQSILHDSFI